MTVWTVKEVHWMTLQTWSKNAWLAQYQKTQQKKTKLSLDIVVTKTYKHIHKHIYLMHFFLFWKSSVIKVNPYIQNKTHYLRQCGVHPSQIQVLLLSHCTLSTHAGYLHSHCGTPLYDSLLLWATCDISSWVDVAVGDSTAALWSGWRHNVAVSLLRKTLHRNT